MRFRVIAVLSICFLSITQLIGGCTSGAIWEETEVKVVKILDLNPQDMHSDWYLMNLLDPAFVQINATEYLFGAGSRIYLYNFQENTVQERIKLKQNHITTVAYDQEADEVWIAAKQYEKDDIGVVLHYKGSELEQAYNNVPCFDMIILDQGIPLFIQKENVFIDEIYCSKYKQYRYDPASDSLVSNDDKLVLSSVCNNGIRAVAWCEQTEDGITSSTKTDINFKVYKDEEILASFKASHAIAGIPQMGFAQNKLYFSVDYGKQPNKVYSKLYQLDITNHTVSEVQENAWKDCQIYKLYTDIESNGIYIFGRGIKMEDNYRAQIITEDGISYLKFDWDYRIPQIISRKNGELSAVAFSHDNQILNLSIK